MSDDVTVQGSKQDAGGAVKGSNNDMIAGHQRAQRGTTGGSQLFGATMGRIGMLTSNRKASAAQAAVLEVAGPQGKGWNVPGTAAPCHENLQPAARAGGGSNKGEDASSSRQRNQGQGGCAPSNKHGSDKWLTPWMAGRVRELQRGGYLLRF